MSLATKVSTITDFLEGRQEYCQFGSLVCRGQRIYTYGVLLAYVNRSEITAPNGHGRPEIQIELNAKNYSKTSSAHKNLVVLAAGCCDNCAVEMTWHNDGLPSEYMS